MAGSHDAQARSPYLRDENREDRSYTTLGTVLLALLVVVLVLIFWRTCTADTRSGNAGGGGGVISEVPELRPADSGVAVWLKPGEDIDRVLARNGLADATYTDLGEGTYVISIGEADAGESVERLKEDDGLYDAGFLFLEEPQD